ncbi:hypothetical protein IAQ61_002585 [Plenodomus lingam]|uniref:Predicted protein n=1 Tax=Leptosphaeria maculans (strain JN3 / isolate v23.1.3 / race Av1-4-5-6-7-8) TaxID=985895 RepID=E4ZHY3_LEPMJ|nr:predicted protein [Plenodomus lingam JN3]KAH9877222.1 hypothetical protein IAQ61_002585 [Plenodomus lingam]CBX91126.1 predicted protein [Plenodomus lingam JN3]
MERLHSIVVPLLFSSTSLIAITIAITITTASKTSSRLGRVPLLTAQASLLERITWTLADMPH